MKVRELKEFLRNVHDEPEIVLASDEEENSHAKMHQAYTGQFWQNVTKEVTDDDGIPCIVFVP